MGYRCWAERFVTADFSGSPVHYQKAVFSETMALIAVRSRFVVYNNPTMTTLSMRIYSSVSNAPSALLHTFDTTWTKAQMTAYDHGAREVYFEFTQPRHLVAGDTYFFVPWISGYTGNDTSHIAWVKSYPDPFYTTGVTNEGVKAATMPYSIGFIGGAL